MIWTRYSGGEDFFGFLLGGDRFFDLRQGGGDTENFTPPAGGGYVEIFASANEHRGFSSRHQRMSITVKGRLGHCPGK